MSEYDNQRYYYIIIKENILTSEKVDFLMEQGGGENGAKFVMIYQLIALKTANNNGVLGRTIGEVLIPYDAEKIQRDLKWFSLETIKVALEYYKALGMIYQREEDGLYQIHNFDNMVGSRTNGADRKRLTKEAKNNEQIEGGNIPQKVHHILDNKDYILDIKDKDSIYKENKEDIKDCNTTCNMQDIPDFNDIHSFGKQNNIDWNFYFIFYKRLDRTNWILHNGEKVNNWKGLLLSNWKSYNQKIEEMKSKSNDKPYTASDKWFNDMWNNIKQEKYNEATENWFDHMIEEERNERQRANTKI